MQVKMGTLREKAESFILYKKSLGYVYNTHQKYLISYIAFSENNYPRSDLPDKSSVMSFLEEKASTPGSFYNCAAVLREFSRFLHSLGFSSAYCIPPKRTPKISPAPPYFFTQNEINKIFDECDKVVPNKQYLGRDIVIPAMLRLLYCCGLRCKETTSLLRQNVNLIENYIDIEQSKGPKSRRLFISNELSDYLRIYESQIGLIFPDRTYFFPHRVGSCYESSILNRCFRKFWANAFPDFDGEIHPTVYDFRHHFAYYNLNRWSREGLDVNVMLPYLMRYMGHKSIKSTLYYFHFVPEYFPTYQELSAFSEDIIPEVHYGK